MRPVRLAAIVIATCLRLSGQLTVPPAADVLLVGQYRTPLSYEAVLARLDALYQEQVGRPGSAVLPRIAEGVHYEAWHDMWVFFAARDGRLTVTVKRPTDAATVLVAKGWMLQMAGRSGGELPLHFEEQPPLRPSGGEIYGSRRDAEQALAGAPSMVLLPTWQHAGLLVSPVSLSRVTLAPAGLHGVHRFTAMAESAAAAKQLAARLTAGMVKPCVCAAYSETAEIEEELRSLAAEKASDVNATSVQRIYLTTPDPKAIEDKLRADPATQKRLAAAAGWFGVKYRVDRPYAKVTIRWTELAGYSRATAKFENERPLGASSVANVKPPAQPGLQLTGRTRLAALKPGAYRIAIEGETAAGETARIDQRDYWFDGKTFEEM